MKKQAIQTTYLAFDREGGFGECGLSLFDSFNTGFCPVYNGSGIFHDVFEHGFEQTDPYFQESAQLNIGGEMTAMGAAWYFFDQLKVSVCPDPTTKFADQIRLVTENLIKEEISCYCGIGFGEELVCRVPDQPPVENKILEHQIKALFKNIKAAPLYKDDDERRQRRQECQSYKDSVTFDKIANLYRYGYRKAQAMAIKDKANTTTLKNFIAFWDKFCLLHEAEDLADVHEGIEFNLFNENDLIHWEAVFIRKDEYEGKQENFRRIPDLNKETKVRQYFKPSRDSEDEDDE